MDFTATQSLHALSDDDIARLVSIALEEFGSGLTRTQFNEAMLALLEHIAGLETLPAMRRQRYLTLLWVKYQQAIVAHPHRH